MIIKFINELSRLDEKTVKKIESDLAKLETEVVKLDFINSIILKALETAYITVTVVDEESIHSLNFENRNVDKATDVLSFPLINFKNGQLIDDYTKLDFEYDVNGNTVLNLGDIIICPSVAQKTADDLGHSLAREMIFLVCHSILHLFGFDHVNDDEGEKLMIHYQKEMMRLLGYETEEFKLNDHKDDIPGLADFDSDIIYPAGSPCKHVGFVAILGRPNVGKSTLLNYITGMKVAIVSHKPQTTRTNIRSIYNEDDTQIIFVDTPGVHNPKSRLSEIMVENSFKSATNADVVLMIVDGRFVTPATVEKRLIELCSKNNKKVILAINKADDVVKESLLPSIANYSKLYNFEQIIPISAKTGENVDVLLQELANLLPEGQRLFDSQECTSQTEREIASELIREQLLHYTNQEIPHGAAVEIAKFEERFSEDATDADDRNMVVIHANIVVERKSHKSIVIGRDGQMIKRIGTKARINIERMCGCKVYLDLFVKVRDDWKNDEAFLRSYGYRVEED